MLDDYEAAWQADEQSRDELPGLYTYVAELIWPDYLELALSAAEQPSDLAVFFAWLEELAVAGTEDDVTFVDWGMLELVGDRDAWLRRATALMGPTTRQLSVETEAFWGRTHNAGE